ncbi:MAG: BON domain-containing protein [Caldimonas sp.]
MTPSLRRTMIAGPVAALALVGLLSGCQKTSTTQSPDGATTSTTTTTVTPTTPSPSTTESMRSAGNEVAADAKGAMNKAGEVLDDSAITAKVKTALLADPTVKGLQIDVDTKNGVVSLKGSVPKAESDRAVQIARETSGVKSVDNQLTPKS